MKYCFDMKVKTKSVVVVYPQANNRVCLCWHTSRANLAMDLHVYTRNYRSTAFIMETATTIMLETPDHDKERALGKDLDGLSTHGNGYWMAPEQSDCMHRAIIWSVLDMSSKSLRRIPNFSKDQIDRINVP